jgi:hypothetical protein
LAFYIFRKSYFLEVSQVGRCLASAGLCGGAKWHCCIRPIMIDAGQQLSLSGRKAWLRTDELARDTRGSAKPDFARRDGLRRD